MEIITSKIIRYLGTLGTLEKMPAAVLIENIGVEHSRFKKAVEDLTRKSLIMRVGDSYILSIQGRSWLTQNSPDKESFHNI